MFEHKEYVYAVYQEKSFSKAAQKLYVTQPCLSAMVKKIEMNLGVQLFNRKTKPISLTEYGEEYIRSVRQIILLEKQFDSYLTDVRGLKTGSVSIGASSVCASHVLPKIIRRFSQSYPDISIDVHEGTIDHLEDSLKSGYLDLVLDNYPVDPKVNHISALRRETLYVALPEQHLSSIDPAFRVSGVSAQEIVLGRYPKQAVNFRVFKQTPFLILRKGNDTRNRFDLLCAEACVAPPVSLELDQLVTAYSICSDGLGATLVSDTLVREEDRNSLIFFAIDSSQARRDLFFHYPTKRYVSAAVEAFMREAARFSS